MLRPLIKTGAARALTAIGAQRLFRALSRRTATPVVLGYHRVVKGFSAASHDSIPAMLISIEMLQHHLDWLERRYRFISLDEIARRFDDGESFREPSVAITFDDGYEDFYRLALPIFKARKIPVAMFVVTELLGTPNLHVHDELFLLINQLYLSESGANGVYEVLAGLGIAAPVLPQKSLNGSGSVWITQSLLQALPQSDHNRLILALRERMAMLQAARAGLQTLRWEMISEMRAAGVVIGSHTATHPLLPNEPLSKIRRELLQSRLKLEERLRTRIVHFAYPAGKFNAAVVEAASGAGYRFAYTACCHRDSAYPLLTIPRKLLWENSCIDARGRFSPAAMNCLVNWVFEAVNGCSDDHGWTKGTAPAAPEVWRTGGRLTGIISHESG